MNDDHGFDRTGVTEESLKEHGRSITELESFVDKAMKLSVLS